MNLAIAIGISEYDNCDNLSACKNDVDVMHNILKKLEKFDDICLISNTSIGIDAKQKISAFVNKHKTDDVNELFFYFSGHGMRHDEDFFYIFTDFSENTKEGGGLRNTELDGLIRNLSPKLTVKVVDACYSGTIYIKSTNDIEPIFKSSAISNKLNNLYFYYSSDEQSTSFANENFSYFSYSFFKALTQNQGNVRHRDIMAFIADDMEKMESPKPVFISQADFTESFGTIDEALLKYLSTKLEYAPKTLIEQQTISESLEQKDKKSLLELAKINSDEKYCTKEIGFDNLKLLQDCLLRSWSSDIKELYEINLEEPVFEIPNAVKIGRWVKQNKNNYFVIPTYSTESYEKLEYVQVPQKPFNKKDVFRNIAILMENIQGDIKYKLEKITKQRKVLDGIEFTTDTPFEVFHIHFEPKFKVLENYVLTIVPVFSQSELVVFNSFENLKQTGWEEISKPMCTDWEIKNILLINREEIKGFCEEKISSISSKILKNAKYNLMK